MNYTPVVPTGWTGPVGRPTRVRGMLAPMRWFGIDLLLVSGFALLGRASHGEALSVADWWHTAWPFLVGAVVGWAVVAGLRWPGGSLAAGAVVGAATVAVGMVLRRVSDQGTAWPFVVVASLVVLGLLLGSRALARRGSR